MIIKYKHPDNNKWYYTFIKSRYNDISNIDVLYITLTEKFEYISAGYIRKVDIDFSFSVLTEIYIINDNEDLETTHTKFLLMMR